MAKKIKSGFAMAVDTSVQGKLTIEGFDLLLVPTSLILRNCITAILLHVDKYCRGLPSELIVKFNL